MTVHDVPRAVQYQGTHYALTDLCRKFNLNYQLVYSRLRAGWTLTDAIEKAPRPARPTSRELKRYDYLGEQLTIEELAQKSRDLANDSAVPGSLIRARIIKGWSIEDAVEVAPLPKGSRRKRIAQEGQQGESHPGQPCENGNCLVEQLELFDQETEPEPATA
jgi:hypothetical protein